MNIDKNSKEWREIESFVTGKIDDLRKSNDNELNEIETADLRGQIKFAKLILDLPEDQTEPVVRNQSYGI